MRDPHHFDKKINLSQTPEKTSNLEAMGENRVKYPSEANGDTPHEPTIADVLWAINKLDVKLDEQARNIKSVQCSVDNLDERLTTIEDSVENCALSIYPWKTTL